MADTLIKQGQEAWYRHRTGNCGTGICEHCEKEFMEKNQKRGKVKYYKRS